MDDDSKENKPCEEHLSESDDELPEVFTPVKPKVEFKKEDLVFAKFQKCPYWPGVFYRYHRNKRKRQKAYVYFFDRTTDLSEVNSKKRILPVCVNKVKSFTCSERDEIIHSGSKKEKGFSKSMEHADEYMRKRALGKLESFFEYTVEEEHCSEDEDDDNVKENQVDSPQPLQNISDTENEVTNRNLFDIPTQCTKETKNVITWIRHNSRALLRDIKNSKIPSKRHQTFHNGSQTEKDKLRWYSGFGKLDEETGQEIFELLLSWFQEDFHGSRYNAISYVSDVWLPEAYIHALSQTKNILFEEAEKEYLR